MAEEEKKREDPEVAKKRKEMEEIRRLDKILSKKTNDYRILKEAKNKGLIGKVEEQPSAKKPSRPPSGKPSAQKT